MGLLSHLHQLSDRSRRDGIEEFLHNFLLQFPILPQGL
jgi:hypothetical protein